MAKVLECGAIFLGCGHVIRAGSEEEVLKLAAAHAREVHGVDQVDETMVEQVRSKISNE
jgi:predicted small metal-binding protein